VKVRFQSPKSKNPDAKDGLKMPYAPAKRVFPKWRWFLVVLIVCSPFLYFLFKIGSGLFFAISPGNIEMERVAVTAPRPCVVEAVLAKEGKAVKEGDVLFSIKPTVQPERLQLLKAERDALLENYPQPDDASKLKELLALAKQEVDYRRKILKDTEELFNKGAATRAELNLAQSAFASAWANYIRQKDELNKMEDAKDPQYEVRLRQLEAEIKLLEEGERPIEVRSPVDGLVTEIFVVPNQTVAQGGLLASMVDTKTAALVTYVEPQDLHFVSPGRPVTLRFPGGKIVKAKVKEIPTTAQALPYELRTPFSENQIAVKVILEPTEPIPEDLMVEGLPFSAHWGFHLKFWE